MAKIACSGWRATAAGTRKSARDSSVTLRQLDPIEWYVHQYDEGSGACLIVLGIEPERGEPHGRRLCRRRRHAR